MSTLDPYKSKGDAARLVIKARVELREQTEESRRKPKARRSRRRLELGVASRRGGRRGTLPSARRCPPPRRRRRRPRCAAPRPNGHGRFTAAAAAANTTLRNSEGRSVLSFKSGGLG